MSEPVVDVRENPDESRFEVWFDGDLAGFTVYEQHEPRRWAFVHTEIDPAFEGHGLGSQLVRRAMESMADRGIAVLPYCPFVKSWLGKHPELAHVVPEDERAEFEL